MKRTVKSTYQITPYIDGLGFYGQPSSLTYPEPTEPLQRITTEAMRTVPDAVVIETADGSQVRFYEVNPLTENDESRVIVRVMDFANGIAPHSYASALAVAELLGHKVIVLPWNDIHLRAHERDIVRMGDFEPIVQRQAEALGKYALGCADITVYGYSLGAQVAPHLSRVINQNGVVSNDRLVMFEPPNTVGRSKYQLLRDFSAAGNTDWKFAIDDANWQSLSNLVDEQYMKRDNALFVRNAVRPTNLAIINAMRKPTFASDVQCAGVYMPAGESTIVIAKELTSAIVPKYGLKYAHDKLASTIGSFGRDILVLLIAPFDKKMSVGHAVGNNPLIAASVIARSNR